MSIEKLDIVSNKQKGINWQAEKNRDKRMGRQARRTRIAV